MTIPYLPLELPGLVEIGSWEYAGQVTETQAWHGGWSFREAPLVSNRHS